MKYSYVIPTYNEEGNLESLYNELKEVAEQLSGEYEIIFVNDGSRDNTLTVLQKIPGITIINLQRNYGQTTALDAGFRHASGEYIITLDADMQNDPHDIPKMLDVLHEQNVDVVVGWRKKRQDKNGIKILTRVGRFFRRVLINDHIHDTGCTLRVYTNMAAKSLDIQGEMHRYIVTLLRWKGFSIAEMEVNHRPRKSGTSKYNYQKAIKGFLDLIYIWFINKYYQRPLHLFGTIGLVLVGLGFLAEGWMMYQKMIEGIDLSDNAWFVLGIFLILTGVILFSMGMILDLLIHIQFATSPVEKRYYIRDVIRT